MLNYQRVESFSHFQLTEPSIWQVHFVSMSVPAISSKAKLLLDAGDVRNPGDWQFLAYPLVI